MMLKVAMLVALSESTELVLRPHHLEGAIAILSLVEKNLPRVFQSMGKNQLNIASTKLLDLLRRCPTVRVKQIDGKEIDCQCITTKKLRASLWQDINNEDFDKVIEFLKQTDRITTAQRTEGGVMKDYVILKPT
jgi:hypothetical protein